MQWGLDENFHSRFTEAHVPEQLRHVQASLCNRIAFITCSVWYGTLWVCFIFSLLKRRKSMLVGTGSRRVCSTNDGTHVCYNIRLRRSNVRSSGSNLINLKKWSINVVVKVEALLGPNHCIYLLRRKKEILFLHIRWFPLNVGWSTTNMSTLRNLASFTGSWTL